MGYIILIFQETYKVNVKKIGWAFYSIHLLIISLGAGGVWTEAGNH